MQKTGQVLHVSDVKMSTKKNLKIGQLEPSKQTILTDTRKIIKTDGNNVSLVTYRSNEKRIFKIGRSFILTVMYARNDGQTKT